MTPLGHVHYPDGLTGSDIYQDDFSNPKFSENPIRVDGSDLRIKAKLTFIHEMSHVWQFQKGVLHMILYLRNKDGYLSDPY